MVGWKKSASDDDPFDDPFGDALHVSSGLQTTRDSSAVDDESVGGENAVKGGVARVDVRIRGEFLRYKDAREVAVCITLSKPPPGPFDLSAVTEDTGWPRSKVARYGWIERNRVEDLLHGLWDQDGRRFWRKRIKTNSGRLYAVDSVYCCECGPEDRTLTVSQVTAMNVTRATKRAVGTSKKCGCKKQYVLSELNSDAIRIVSPQTVSVRDLVRVSWDPAESHAATCARSQSVAMLRTTRAILQRMIAQHPTYTAHKIQECWREHVKKYQMQLHGWKDEYQFHEYARAPDNANFLADIDFNIPVATINNIRENIRGTKWRYMHNLKTHREMSQSMSKNSKMDGDGVIGMSNLVAIPMRGAAGDSALSRKRGWHEKMVDEHKRKASKGEQISIRN